MEDHCVRSGLETLAQLLGESLYGPQDATVPVSNSMARTLKKAFSRNIRSQSP